MTVEQYVVIFYALFWLVRINGCIRRGRQPLLRGREWFFNVRVRPDFYSGPGKQILHRYWLRMLLPFAVDIPVAAAIFYTGRVVYLNYLILALCGLIHLNHVISVDRAERQARPFAMADDNEPVTRVMSSLKPRRLRDYTNAKLEWALTLATLFVLLWLIRSHAVTPVNPELIRQAIVVFFLLYLHAGLLYVKCVIVAWRTPVPQVQAAEFLEAREEARRYYLRVCDWGRISITAGALFWPLSASMPRAQLDRLLSVWLVAWLAIGIVATVWGEIRRKQLTLLTLRARPAKLPDLMPQSGLARWPVCYEPSTPMLVLKGARGYSLNMANALAFFGAAYLAGFIALLAVLPIHH